MPEFRSGIVVAGHPLACRAGATMLRNGGNAIDAAVATALALGVVTPAFCGIGGGGFALIWLAKEEKAVFIDYRERAPRAARADMFRLTHSGGVARHENSIGYKAVGVPGSIAGHSYLLEKFGNLNLRNAISPAITYARKGFRVSRALSNAWKQSAFKLKRYRASSVYLRNHEHYGEGTTFTPRALGESYRLIATHGPNALYSGEIAHEICRDMEENGGLLRSEDLEGFKPTVREAVRNTYRGFELISAPPPSAGGATILQALNMLEGLSITSFKHNSTMALHFIAESFGRALSNCRSQVCDPDTTEVPISQLVSKNFAKSLMDSTNLTAVSNRKSTTSAMPTSSTSHLVAVDSEHNVASITESVECYFGSGVVVPDTGIVLNDTMHDFDPHPNQLNSVGSGKIPMSSMSPTIVMKDGRPFMIVGSAGATRIISSTLQTIVNILDYGMPIAEAVSAPRIHVQDDELHVETGIPRNSIAGLRKMGHKIKLRQASEALYFGGVHAALIGSKGISGAADPRRDGMALGLR